MKTKEIKYSDGLFYDEYVKGKSFFGPRGECYSYAFLLEGHIVAVGEEQGNYSGGILRSVRKDGKESVEKYVRALGWGESVTDKDLFEKLSGNDVHDTGCPVGTHRDITIDLYALNCLEKLALKSKRGLYFDDDVLKETLFNLEKAAKAVEKKDPANAQFLRYFAGAIAPAKSKK